MKYILLILLMFSQDIFSQKIDKSKKIKSTREKIIFINDSIQNYKLFSFDGDYGHSGFISPKATIERFHEHWYNEIFVHYINNKRNFNEKGLLINEDWFYKDDKKLRSYEYQYAEFDSLKRIKKSSYFDNEFQVTNITYNNFNNIHSILNYWPDDSHNFNLEYKSYNENSKISKIEKYTNEGFQWSKSFVYNKQNSLIKKTHLKPTIWSIYDVRSFYQKKDSLGTKFDVEINLYLEKKIIEKKTYYEPGYDNISKLRSITIYNYDNLDKLQETQESIFSYPNFISKITEKKSARYDSTGNVLETKNIFLDGNKMIMTHSFKFDKKNRKIFESDITENFSSGYDFRKYFYYDGDELKKLIVISNKIKYLVDFTYKYDEYGNWVERTKSINGKKLFVWNRSIEYY